MRAEVPGVDGLDGLSRPPVEALSAGPAQLAVEALAQDGVGEGVESLLAAVGLLLGDDLGPESLLDGVEEIVLVESGDVPEGGELELAAQDRGPGENVP